MTTNYTNSFIAVSPDTEVETGLEPKAGTIAAEQLRRLRADPYGYTSDELLFVIQADRNGLAVEDRDAAWRVFQEKPMACLRASALVKQYGWGIHHDAEAKVAAYAVDSDVYRELSVRDDLKQFRGMRSKRASG